MKTNYTLKPKGNWIAVMFDGKQEAITIDEESALHCVWTLEDKPVDEFFVVDRDGVVSRIDRGVL